MEVFLILAIILIIFIYITSIYTLIFLEKKDPASTMWWLLVMIILPLVGIVLFYFFGSKYKLKIFTKKYSAKTIEEIYSEFLAEHVRDLNNKKLSLTNKDVEEYRKMIIMNAKNSNSFYSENNTAKLLINGEEKFENLFKDLKSAKETINVLYYIFKPSDKVGREFLDILVEKAKEGVEVRLIYDRFGSFFVKRKDFKRLIDAGGYVYAYMPSFFKSFLQMNYRMHRKIVTIDGDIGYVGGINVGDEYMSKNKKFGKWRDTSIRVTGSSVEALQLRFICDWVFLDKQSSKRKLQEPIGIKGERIEKFFKHKRKTNGNVGIQVISSGPESEYPFIKDSYIKIITSAKEYIYIQTPYFVADETLFDALRLAAKSGVDVRLMIPGVPDKWYAYYVTLSYIEDLLKSGARVYVYNGFIHSKTMIMDDMVATVGTTNIDQRSFMLNYETNATIYNNEFAIESRNQFFSDIESSEELKVSDYKKRGLITRICEAFFRLFSGLV